jgi:uncharacterized damage-inducible protein DinB
MPPAIDTLVEVLAKAQSEFLRAADTVSPANWKTRPGEGRWSAAELVAHLVSVEKAVVEKADRVSQKPPRHIPLYKRFRLPIRLAESRLIRLKSPVPVLPEFLRGKEEMLAELREARERSLAFLEETQHRELGVYLWRHPALGMLNTYGWMEFLAAHENRHTKQMREIVRDLPKAIERLQK